MSTEEEFQIPDDVANTDNKTDKPKRSRRPSKPAGKNKGDIFTAEYCTEIYYLLHTSLLGVMGETTTKREKDFAARGATLSKLAEKYFPVAVVLKAIDPLLFIIGVYNDHKDHVRNYNERRAQKKAAKQAAKGAQQGVMILDIPSEQQPYYTS